MNLDAIKQALSAELNSDTAVRFINTRLILRTGVDLHRADLSLSDELLARVKQELQAMGFLRGFQ